MTRHDPTRAYRPRRAPTTVEDRDACALYAWLAKDARPTHDAIDAALVALDKMLHRAGNVGGEGDGCGLSVDIPRELWAEAQRLYATELSSLPLYFRSDVFILPKWLSGVRPTGNQSPTTLWITDWSVQP